MTFAALTDTFHQIMLFSCLVEFPPKPLDFSFSLSGLISGFAVTLCAILKTNIWNFYFRIQSFSEATVCILLVFFFSQHLCDLPLQAAQKRPLGVWNEKVFLRTHPSVMTSRGGGGTHGPSQIHSCLSAAVFAWHNAPERSLVCEITFIQPSHAWLDYFGCRRKAARRNRSGLEGSPGLNTVKESERKARYYTVQIK